MSDAASPPEAGPMTDAEVASLAAEIGNLCVDIGRQWEELDSARAELSAEDRGNERAENARIERSHSVMLRKVFDRYRRAAPALPVGRSEQIAKVRSALDDLFVVLAPNLTPDIGKHLNAFVMQL